MKKAQICIFLFIIVCFYLINAAHYYCNDFEGIKEDYCSKLLPQSEEYKCNYSNGECKNALYGCSSYTGIDPNECKARIPSDSEEKKCILQSGICKEVTKECSEYEGNYESKCNKFSAGDPLKICRFNKNNKCEAHYKLCSSITDEQTCKNNIPSNKFMECLWDGTCKDKYKNYIKCDEYKGTDSLECSKYQPLSDSLENLDLYSKCQLNEINQCIKIKKTCKELEELIKDDYMCSSDISKNAEVDDPTNKICISDSWKCKEEYKSCSHYNSAVEIAKRNKNDCESILNIDDYSSSFPNILYSKICEFDEVNSVCNQKDITSCNEYKIGLPRDFCERIQLSDNSKRCRYINNKCEEYRSCNDYSGGNKNICEAIIIGDPQFKCKFDETIGCYQTKKECSDDIIEDLYECSLHISLDPLKHCIIRDNKCVEEFKTCESYSVNVKKDVCENIILLDNEQYKKCVFESSSGLCKTERKTCEDFKLFDQKTECEDIHPLVGNSKCVFHNDICVNTSLVCSELDKLNGANEELCNQASTTNTNLICSLKNDKSGCQEIERPITKDNKISSSQPETNPIEEKEKNNKSNNFNSYSLSKIIFLIVYYLL